MGKLHHFFGLKIVQDEATGTVWIGQPAYTRSLLQRFGMEEAIATPVDTGARLMKTNVEEECWDQKQIPVSSWKPALPLSCNQASKAFAVGNVARRDLHVRKLDLFLWLCIQALS